MNIVQNGFRTACLLLYLSIVGSMGGWLPISLGPSMTKIPFGMWSVAVAEGKGTNQSLLLPVPDNDTSLWSHFGGREVMAVHNSWTFIHKAFVEIAQLWFFFFLRGKEGRVVVSPCMPHHKQLKIRCSYLCYKSFSITLPLRFSQAFPSLTASVWLLSSLLYPP